MELILRNNKTMLRNDRDGSARWGSGLYRKHRPKDALRFEGLLCDLDLLLWVRAPFLTGGRRLSVVRS